MNYEIYGSEVWILRNDDSHIEGMNDNKKLQKTTYLQKFGNKKCNDNKAEQDKIIKPSTRKLCFGHQKSSVVVNKRAKE